MKLNRWIYVVIGVIVLICTSLIYAWSVLSIPIAAEFTNWNNAMLSFTFTIAMISFCLGGFVGAILSSKINIKINIWIAAALFLLGFIISSKTQTAGMLYIGFGIFGGFASGLVYNAVNGTISKWFPDKQGFVSGILLMGFGLGSFVIGKLYQFYVPKEIGGWRAAFLAMGIIIFFVLVIGGFFFKKPDEDFSYINNDKKNNVLKYKEVGIDVPPTIMLKRVSFWLFFTWCIILSGSGLALVSQAGRIVKEVTPNINAGVVATLVGLISICNGCGRVIFGTLFDRIGRKLSIIAVNVSFITFIVLIILALIKGNLVILILSFVIGGISYGGIVATNAAFINAFYGATHYSVNFSIATLNLIFASFGSTIAGAVYDATGSYVNLFLIMLCAVVAAFGGTFFIKKP